MKWKMYFILKKELCVWLVTFPCDVVWNWPKPFPTWNALQGLADVGSNLSHNRTENNNEHTLFKAREFIKIVNQFKLFIKVFMSSIRFSCHMGKLCFLIYQITQKTRDTNTIQSLWSVIFLFILHDGNKHNLDVNEANQQQSIFYRAFLSWIWTFKMHLIHTHGFTLL